MGMCIDLKVGEEVIAHVGGERMRIRIERKSGANGVRLVIDAPPFVVLQPPSRQEKITPP